MSVVIECSVVDLVNEDSEGGGGLVTHIGLELRLESMVDAEVAAEDRLTRDRASTYKAEDDTKLTKVSVVSKSSSYLPMNSCRSPLLLAIILKNSCPVVLEVE